MDTATSAEPSAPTTALYPSFDYVELLAKSNFSFLQAASHPEEMVHTAQALGYRGIGLCDSNGLYGVVRGYKAASQPSHFDPMHIELMRSRSRNRDFRYLIGSEVLLLNRQSVALMPVSKYGYSQLCRLLTVAKRSVEKYHARISMQDLLNHQDDLLFFPLPPWKEDFVLKLQEDVGHSLFLPVYRDRTWLSETYQQQAFDWERRHGLKLFATQLPLMHEPGRKPLHDALVCIQKKLNIEEAANHLLLNRERHLKPLPDLYDIWKDRPDLLDATKDIADQVDFSLNELRYRYPRSRLPEDMTPKSFLRKKTEEGLLRRYPDGVPDKARKQLEYELAIIADLEYEDYFLTLWDVCEFARARDILFQGRGSAANSIVCYTLGLTAIDPLQFSCTFERFLSKERNEPPDIDIDFEHERREEVIQYIYGKYGPEYSGMVCTVISYRTRMAIRELSKVFDLPLETVNSLVRYMGKEGLQRLIDDPPKPETLDVPQKKLQLIVQLTRELVGFPRHIGIHTGGFVISHDPLIDSVPVEKATMEGRYVVQWNKDDIDTLKMMKVDVLGLGMLTALKRCQALFVKHKGEAFDLSRIPQDDPATYEMIQNADTVGVFQIESRAQMSMLPRLRPKNFYDLVIEVAIVRPGPLQGGMVHPFLKRKQGKEEVSYHHPSLEPILKKTMGIPIFQEQVLLMASAVAGFTPGEAEELRRLMSMSWRREGHMSQLRQRLLSGMLEKGVSKDYAEQIYKMIEGFASYGFPESHAASFALLTYASSYLKRHHPAIFTCGLLNSQPMGFYSPRSLIADAQRHGVGFLPLDIQFSEYDYALEGEKIRVGLRSVFGVPREFLQKVFTEREKHGPYRDLADFIRRTHPTRAYLGKLASAEAFRSFGLAPRELLWGISSIDLDVQSLGFAQTSAEPNPWIPDENDWQKLHREYRATGVCLEHHPLKILRPHLEKRNRIYQSRGWIPYSTSADLVKCAHGTKLRLAGIICVHQKPPTAKGFVFLTFEDEFGMMNIVIKPDIYKKYRDRIQYGALLEIHGELEFIDNVRNVQAKKIFTVRPDGLVYDKAMPSPSFSI